MANLVGGTKVEYHVKNGSWTNLDELVDAITDYGDNLEDEVDALAAADANDLLATLSEKYETYMNTYGPRSVLAEDDPTAISNIRLNKYEDKWYGAPTIYVTKKGKCDYNVTISGKDILYQEFGTGTVGKSDRYPFKSAAKLGINKSWDYVVGEKIIRNHRYINGGNLLDSAPQWYEDALEDGKITTRMSVWRSPRGITEGNHAGRFVYDTFNEYRGSIDADAKLGKKTIYLMTKNRILKGKKGTKGK